MQKRISELFLRSYILTLLDTLDNGGRHKGSYHPGLHGVYMHIALLPLQSSGLLRCLKCRRTINKSQLSLERFLLITFLLNLSISYNITLNMFTEARWIGHLTLTVFQVFQCHAPVTALARGAGTTNCTWTTPLGCILWITASMAMSARISIRPTLNKKNDFKIAVLCLNHTTCLINSVFLIDSEWI